MEADGQRENPVLYIPGNENYGVVKFTPSIKELSINFDLRSFQVKSKKKVKRLK
jgi:hypothetical protein